ncbi:ferredoxin [Acaryochloris sp. IP29b_bin.137]|uniref:(2Fe-2S) ferredoxin domain-containing protein n=1 Tax=Acaryochloris sp. IP29b_bin.137 TaxID=2969217 RepID=UPI00262F2410|nr:ferredoxin [Acaryochloris sp. IP29b_bin.137]
MTEQDVALTLPRDATPAEYAALQKTVQALGLARIQRHIFICADQTVDKCCDKASSLAAWAYLKTRLKELKLDNPTAENFVFRTKANCLRVCQRGPIMVIYPDGVWYHSAAPPVIERILQEHLLGNQIVEDYLLLHHPLTEIELQNSRVYGLSVDGGEDG